MDKLTLTNTFYRQWYKRVGNWPTIEAVRHYLDHSVHVQSCQDLLRKDGTPYRVLAIYWHPELDLVIKVDTERGSAVSVLTRENWKYADGHTPAANPGPEPLMHRIARIRDIFGHSVGPAGRSLRRARI